MNTILQKRIEEAAKKEPWLSEESFVNGCKYILDNLWISVEEAPQADIPNCFVAYRAINMVLYSTGSYEKDNDEWYVDGVGFNAEVTHWMPIPTLEGGEK